MQAQVHTIPATIRSLRETPPPDGGVLSVYLDTSAGKVAGRGHLLAYRDGCKALRESIPDAERAAFEAAVDQGELHLVEKSAPGAPGLAIFASGAPDYFFAVPLPKRPQEGLAWEDAPRIGPIVGQLDDCERIAVLLFDKERARLLTMFLGEIEDRQAMEDEVPGKQATGGWFALSQTRYARHHEDHVLRHVKRTIDLAMTALRAHPFERLLIGGPDEATSLLRHHLPRPLRARLAGQLNLELFASDADVRQAALRVADELERRDELALVDELLDQAIGDRVALGLQATLDALNDGRVHQLFVIETFGQMGAECPICGRLASAGRDCPLCGVAMPAVHDLRERVMERGLAQGARIESVAGEAAARLARYDGIGAWTRY